MILKPKTAQAPIIQQINNPLLKQFGKPNRIIFETKNLVF